MIKIFRNIRKSLVSGNNTTKYLKYAIGEILLVVVGILIALAINNYSEEKKERKKELAYLKEINLDFKSNKIQIDSIVSHNKVSLHAGLRLIEIFKLFDLNNPQKNKSNTQVADSIRIYNSLVWRNKSFNPKNGTVEALLNSSSFDLIQNDTLRRYLISWKDVLGDYLEEEKFAVDFLKNDFDPWLMKSFEPDLDVPENTKALFSKRHRNFIYKRCGDLNNNITAVKEEGVIDMINNIIRLTESKDND